MIHWYRATANLKAVPGTFDEADINASHRRKATSFPPTFNLLISALVAGFSASAEGSAFQSDFIDAYLSCPSWGACRLFTSNVVDPSSFDRRSPPMLWVADSCPLTSDEPRGGEGV